MAELIIKMVKKESEDRIDIKEVITEIYSFKGIKITKPNNTGSRIKIKLIDKSE